MDQKNVLSIREHILQNIKYKIHTAEGGEPSLHLLKISFSELFTVQS